MLIKMLTKIFIIFCNKILIYDFAKISLHDYLNYKLLNYKIYTYEIRDEEYSEKSPLNYEEPLSTITIYIRRLQNPYNALPPHGFRNT